jgi:ElaB/YqjD/DUF883 family membrane-anchored ribosome-binding protein
MANSSTKDKAKEGMEHMQQGAQHMADAAKSGAQNLADTARSAAQNVGEKARQAGEFARDKADQGASTVGKGMESLAGTIRDRGPQEGLLGRATSGVAGALDSTGQYLEQQGVSGMVDDLTGLIRNHPLPAILVGVGIGFMLARLTTSSRS